MKILKITAILVVVCASLVFWPEVSEFVSRNGSKLFPFIDKVGELGEGTLPEPLVNRISVSGKKSDLTLLGVLEFTNIERQKAGLNSLALNEELSLAADLKVDDMFEKGYFAHESPGGVSPAEVVLSAGYDYLSTGENLALGEFDGDSGLVDAWMGSPGHRENILNNSYTDIGIAVKKGFYDGDEVWMAVQEFGIPASFCNKPDDSNQFLVSSLIASLEVLKTQIEELKDTIDSTPKNSSKYNSLISSYNELVKQYNDGVARVGSLSDDYNRDVRIYNNCLEQHLD